MVGYANTGYTGYTTNALWGSPATATSFDSFEGGFSMPSGATWDNPAAELAAVALRKLGRRRPAGPLAQVDQGRQGAWRLPAAARRGRQVPVEAYAPERAQAPAAASASAHLRPQLGAVGPPTGGRLVNSRATSLLREIAAGLRAHQRALQSAWPRRGAPWSLAEDRRLLRLMSARSGREAVHAAARSLGRTPCAVSTRIYVLRAGRRSAT